MENCSFPGHHHHCDDECDDNCDGRDDGVIIIMIVRMLSTMVTVITKKKNGIVVFESLLMSVVFQRQAVIPYYCIYFYIL